MNLYNSQIYLNSVFYIKYLNQIFDFFFSSQKINAAIDNDDTELIYLLLSSQPSSKNLEKFKGNLNLTQIVIPSSITTIGDFSFQDCSKLEKVLLL